MKKKLNKLLFSLVITSTMIAPTFRFFNRSPILATPIEKSISLDVHDFYYQTEVPSIFTTGNTTGTVVEGNLVSTCDIPITGRLGHLSGDPHFGFRVNESNPDLTPNGLHLFINLGSFTLTGLSGTFYSGTTTNRRLTLDGNAIGPNISSTNFPISNPQDINRIDFSTSDNISGMLLIKATGSIGIMELIIYYVETTSGTSSSTSGYIPASSDETTTAVSSSPTSSSSNSELIEWTYNATPNTNEVFLYWKDTRSDKLVSRITPFTTMVSSTSDIEAVYVNTPTLFYETYYNETKSSYLEAELVSNGQTWFFYEAVTGSLAGDKKTTARAARIHGGGHISTRFDLGVVDSVSFSHAIYGSDASGVTLALQWSQNLLSWQNLDNNITPVASLTDYTIQLDILDLYLNGDYDPTKPFYIRIFNQNKESNSTGIRVNIDRFSITQYSATNPFPFPKLNSESNRLNFIYDTNHPLLYELNEPYTPLSTCQAIDPITLSSVQCDIEQNIDTTNTGDYPLVISAMDVFGDLISIEKTVTVLEDLSILEALNDKFKTMHNEYYKSIDSLYGQSLLLELRELSLNQIQRKNYGNARDILPLADVDPNDATRAIEVYTGVSVIGAWGDGTNWEREHIWPNSRLGMRRAENTDANIATDLHNLRVILKNTNITRSNKLFDDANTSNTFNPGPDSGQVARIYLYMYTTYDHLVLTDDIITNLTYQLSGAQSGKLSFLLAMHQAQPVSVFELNRQEVIQSQQMNRNPFIDFPELTKVIFY